MAQLMVDEVRGPPQSRGSPDADFWEGGQARTGEGADGRADKARAQRERAEGREEKYYSDERERERERERANRAK